MYDKWVLWLDIGIQKDTRRLDLNKKYLIGGLFSTQSWLMLRPWLLPGDEPVIVLVPRKTTDSIWIVLASEVWTDLQRRRGSNQVCLWAEWPHSCVVRVALASSNWRSEKVSAVQYSIVWQFPLRPSFQLTLISDLLDCNYMICTECHTFIHLSLGSIKVGGVGRCRGSRFMKTSTFRFNPFEFGLTEALLLSWLEPKNTHRRSA